MPMYGTDFTDFTTPTGTADTALAVRADGAGDQCEVVYLAMMGSGITAAADTQHSAAAAYWDGTTAGTAGATPTPELLTQIAQAARCATTIEYTAEPTNINTVSPVRIGFNQRGGDKWGVPQGIGAGFRLHNADTEEGLLWLVVSSAAGKVDGSVMFWEP